MKRMSTQKTPVVTKAGFIPVPRPAEELLWGRDWRDEHPLTGLFGRVIDAFLSSHWIGLDGKLPPSVVGTISPRYCDEALLAELNARTVEFELSFTLGDYVVGVKAPRKFHRAIYEYFKPRFNWPAVEPDGMTKYRL